MVQNKPLLAVGSVTVGAFAGVTTEFLPVGLLDDIARDLDVSRGTAGLMVTVPALTAALAAPAITLASSRVDRRRVVLALTTLLAASNLLAAVSPSFAAMLAARVLLGLNVGGFWAIAPGLGVRLAGGWSVAKATSLILAGISLGTVLGVPLGTAVGDLAGWRAAFATTGGLALLVLATQASFLPRLPPTNPIRPRNLLTLLESPVARIGIAATVTAFVGQFAAYTYITPFLTDQAGISADWVSTVLLVFGAAGLVGNFVADRNLRAEVAGAVGLVAASVLALAAVGHSPVPAILLLAVWGFAFSGVPLGLQVWMFRAAPDAPDGGSALFVSILQISLALGAFLGGRTVDASSVTGAMLVGGVLAASTLVTLMRRAARAAKTCWWHLELRGWREAPRMCRSGRIGMLQRAF